MREPWITTEKDESGKWTAAVLLPPKAAAFGEGETEEEAIADCREALTLLLEELGERPDVALANFAVFQKRK
jgi:predicted RNase H-like HicB family nuclease